MDFFNKALIPDSDAKFIIASAKIGNIKPAMLSSVDEKVRRHSDLSVCHLGGDRFVTADNAFEYYVNKLPGAKIIRGSTAIKSPYPFDAAYCAAVFSHFAVANEKITDRVLLDILKSEFTFINVKQGYSKCIICPVAENAVITEDAGIYKKLSGFMDVLLIEPGHVALPGYGYGFIGGAAGLIGDKKLYFNGRIDQLPDYERIMLFLEKHSVKAVTEDYPLTDIGSVIAVS